MKTVKTYDLLYKIENPDLLKGGKTIDKLIDDLKLDISIRDYIKNNNISGHIYLQDKSNDESTIPLEACECFCDVLLIKAASEEHSQIYYNSLKAVENLRFLQFDYLREIDIIDDSHTSKSINIQWAYDKINCNEAHQYATGKNILIAVLDTGVNYNLKCIEHGLWRNSKGEYGRDFVSMDNDPFNNDEQDGHGTRVTSIIVAKNDTSLKGIAPDSKIISVKVLPDNINGVWGVRDSKFAYSILYAIEKGADIINVSWGIYPDEKKKPILILYAIQEAIQKGISVVCAAGNKGRDVKDFFPANIDEVISVGATDRYDNKYVSLVYTGTQSNIGETITVFAPGKNILCYKSNTECSEAEGTSLAAPHVSGVIALMLELKHDLGSNEIKTILQQTSDEITIEGSKALRINALNSVKYILLNNENKKVLTLKTKTMDYSNVTFQTIDEPQHRNTLTLKNISIVKPAIKPSSAIYENSILSITLKTGIDDFFIPRNVYFLAVEKSGIIKQGLVYIYNNEKCKDVDINSIDRTLNVDVSFIPSNWPNLGRGRDERIQLFTYNECDAAMISQRLIRFEQILREQSNYSNFPLNIIETLMGLSDEDFNSINDLDAYIEGIEPVTPDQSGGVVLSVNFKP